MMKSDNDKLDPRLIEALRRIEELEIENRQLKAAASQPRSLHGLTMDMLDHIRRGPAPAVPQMGGFTPKASQGWEDPNIAMGAPLGFDSGGSKLIAPGEPFRLVSRPKECFQCDRLIIGSDIADLIDIKSLSIGGQKQELTSEEREFIPGAWFSNLKISPKFNFKRAQPGEDIVLEGRVSQEAKKPIRVLATVFGSATVRK